MANGKLSQLCAVFLSLTWFSLQKSTGSTNVQSNCPATIPTGSILKTFNSHCYEFIRIERYWDVAQKDCQSRGGNLLQIRDQATQTYIMNTLTSLRWGKNGLWLGAHDIPREGHWTWVTGDKISWSNWEDGQPSCYVPALRLFCAEDCAVMRISSGGKWHDYRCHSAGFTYSYICQYDMLAITSAAHKVTTLFKDADRGLRQSDYVPTNVPPDYQTDTEFNQTHTISTVLPEEITSNTIFAEEQTASVNISVEANDSENVTADENTTTEYSDVTDQNMSNADNDFIDVQTSYPIEESTHILIEESDLIGIEQRDDQYDYILPEVRAAQTGEGSGHDGSKSLTGPIVGVLMGAFALAGVLVLTLYFYRKRNKLKYDSWAVGFDNPNYDNPAPSENNPAGNVSEAVYEECSRVAMFPPEENGACATSCKERMRNESCQQDMCAVSMPKPCQQNHYVHLDFADESDKRDSVEDSSAGNISDCFQTKAKQTS